MSGSHFVWMSYLDVLKDVLKDVLLDVLLDVLMDAHLDVLTLYYNIIGKRRNAGSHDIVGIFFCRRVRP